MVFLLFCTLITWSQRGAHIYPEKQNKIAQMTNKAPVYHKCWHSSHHSMAVGTISSVGINFDQPDCFAGAFLLQEQRRQFLLTLKVWRKIRFPLSLATAWKILPRPLSASLFASCWHDVKHVTIMTSSWLNLFSKCIFLSNYLSLTLAPLSFVWPLSVSWKQYLSSVCWKAMSKQSMTHQQL